MADAIELLTAGFAALFAIAALAKLLTRAGWFALAGQIIGRDAIVRPVAIAIPLVEAAVAMLLVLRPTLGLPAAAVTLGSFAAAIRLRLGDLEGAECNCFGSLLPMRIGRGLVARNGSMAALAGAAAFVAPHAGAGSPDVFDLAAAVIALAAATLLLRRRPDREPSGPPVGSSVAVPGLERGKPALVVFLAPGCPACEEAAPVVAEVDDLDGRVAILVAVRAAPEREREALAEKARGRARLDLDELWQDWKVPGSPFTVAMDARGQVLTAEFGARKKRLAELSRAALAGALDSPPEHRILPPPNLFETRRPGASALSRRQAIGAATSAFVSMLLPATALGAWKSIRPPTRYRGFSISEDFQDNFPWEEEEFRGTCEEYLDYVVNKGLDTPLGRRKENFGVVRVDDYDFNVTYWDETVKAPGVYCPECATAPFSRPGKCFPTASECTANCRAPIGSCSGTCSQRCGDYCIHVIFQLELDPKGFMRVFRWEPPKNASERCKKYARWHNSQIFQHELIHVFHYELRTKQVNKRLVKSLRVCAPTEEAARQQLNEKIAQLLAGAFAELERLVTEDEERYHKSDHAEASVRLYCRNFCK